MNALGFHVFDGHKWLAEDERSFNDAKLAQDVGEREAGNDHTIYVMACLGWQ